MARKKRKLTPNQQEAKKQETRITRALKRLSKRGYDVSGVDLPKRPSRVTKAYLNKLRALDMPTIYQKSTYLIKETGEIIGGQEARKRERSKAAKRGYQRRIERIAIKQLEGEGITFTESPVSQEQAVNMIISNWKSEINGLNDNAQLFLLNWLDGVIRKYGEAEAARILEEGQGNGLEITRKESYDRAALIEYASRFMDYLEDFGAFERDKFMDAVEEDEMDEYFG